MCGEAAAGDDATTSSQGELRMSTAVRNFVHRTRARTAAVMMAVIAVIAASLAFLPSALASHPEVSLPGSNFEIDTDANIDRLGQRGRTSRGP